MDRLISRFWTGKKPIGGSPMWAARSSWISTQAGKDDGIGDAAAGEREDGAVGEASVQEKGNREERGCLDCRLRCGRNLEGEEQCS
ncbi:hypothetical protein PG985_009798 [Apiospora marii]|uniref:uncharacterized protein n=1 Tax=Apiospora marii TaxID=335849 RepID=UPI00312E3887